MANPKKVAKVVTRKSVSEDEYVLSTSLVQIVVDGEVRIELTVPAGSVWRGAVSLRGDMESA